MDSKEYIIFDLGGVLLNIDYSRTSRAFRQLGVEDFDHLFSQAKQNDVFDAFEKGEMTSAAFRDYLRKISKADLEDDEIDLAWNAMLLDFPEERLQLLEQLNGRYKLILMSNTNSIHLQAFTSIVNSSLGIERFENAFYRVYYSSRIGRRKPDAECFMWILQENDISPSKAFFVDDSFQHVEGARNLEIESLHLTSEKQLFSLSKELMEIDN